MARERKKELKKAELVAHRLRGVRCESCKKFWHGSYCSELTEYDSPICGLYEPLGVRIVEDGLSSG